MSDGNLVPARAGRRVPVRLLRGWKLWEMPRSAWTLILAAEVLTAVGVVIAAIGFQVDSTAIGRWLLIRPWRIAAGICFGLALGTKWSAVWVLAAFGVMAFAWDLGARRALGVRFAFVKSAPSFITGPEFHQ